MFFQCGSFLKGSKASRIRPSARSIGGAFRASANSSRTHKLYTFMFTLIEGACSRPHVSLLPPKSWTKHVSRCLTVLIKPLLRRTIAIRDNWKEYVASKIALNELNLLIFSFDIFNLTCLCIRDFSRDILSSTLLEFYPTFSPSFHATLNIFIVPFTYVDKL